MIAVDDGQPLAVQERAAVEQVERVREQRRVPPVEEVPGDDEVVAPAGDDAIELTRKPDRVVAARQVQIREVGDEQSAGPSSLLPFYFGLFTGSSASAGCS